MRYPPSQPLPIRCARFAVLAAAAFFAGLAHAEVVYTDVPDAYVGSQTTITFGSLTPFTGRGTYTPVSITGTADAGAVGSLNDQPALPAGERIDGTLTWKVSATLLTSHTECHPDPINGYPRQICGKVYTGPWSVPGDHYLALRFEDADGIHYGWARMKAENVYTSMGRFTYVLLEDYAYETTPNAPIAAGETQTYLMSLAPVTDLRDVSAQVNGVISPGGQDLTAHFEWGTSTDYGNSTAPRSVHGGQDIPFPETLTGLMPFTTYHYRLAVQTGAGMRYTADRAFTTGGPVTGAPTDVTLVSATLNGAMPPGSPATAFFEWGLDVSLSHTADAVPADNDGAVRAAIAGLPPNMTCGYQLVAIYPGGQTVRGFVKFFKTVVPPGPCFVNQAATGSPQNGASWSTAFRTVGQAVAAAGSSHEIWVAAGTYKERLSLNGVSLYGGFSGNETSRLQRNPAANVTVLDADHGGAVVRFVGGNSVLDGFTVQNGANVGSADLAGVFAAVGNVTLANNVITGNRCPFAVYVQEGATAVVTGNVIRDNICSAAGLGAAGAATISRNLIYRNTGNPVGGIWVLSPSTTRITDTCLFANSGKAGGLQVDGQATVANCTIARNTASSDGGGILVLGRLTLVNTIVAFNSSGISTGPNAFGQLTPRFNDVFGNDAYAFAGTPDPTGTRGNIAMDPLFVDAAGGDYRLSPASPCIDRGDDSVVATGETDQDGLPRIFGAHVDVGAYEFAPPAGFSLADAARALRLAGGLDAFLAADSRLDVAADGASSGVVDIADAARLARKAAGLDTNP